jgi:hypothetical protein
MARSILSARPSIGTQVGVEDAMELARLTRVPFFQGMPQWAPVHLAEAAAPRRPAGAVPGGTA